MAPPINSGNAAKINSVKSTQTPKKPGIVNSDCLEAAIACTILAKLATKHGEHFSQISKANVLQVINDVRRNRVRLEKANGNELIVQTIDTPEDRMRVSVALKSGSVESLLNLERENPGKLAEILSSTCKELNGPTERKLLKLATKIHIQSENISFNRHAADLVVKGDGVIFA